LSVVYQPKDSSSFKLSKSLINQYRLKNGKTDTDNKKDTIFTNTKKPHLK